MGRVVDLILRWQAHVPDATFVFVSTLDELLVVAALGKPSASPMPSHARAPSR